MKLKPAAAVAILFGFAFPAVAHRLDEYLQAALISVEANRLHASMHLVPGVAVAATLIADIDTNHDGRLSQIEWRSYAKRFLEDLSLSVDGNRLSPQLVSAVFPKQEEIREGLGQIQLELAVDLPPSRSARKLIFENHHRAGISVYLVNCLAPQDGSIQIVAQNRNELQSFYELEYLQTDPGRIQQPPAHGSVAIGSPRKLAAQIASRFRGIAGMFRLGMRHIAEGTDHLLFLLALLLPAPLLERHSHWAGFADIRQSLLRIGKVVTAFTVGHSLTLAIAGWGVLHVPSRPIEVLIAVSILVSALHALRPLFPGREAAIASFFGLIHGLAFATTLGELGVGTWERIASLFGFNLGIEAMQMIVVAATMPSLLLLSRTRAYPALRIGGALFAVFASVCWTGERLLDVHTSVDLVVNSAAQHALWIAGALFLISLFAWSLPGRNESAANPLVAP